MCIAIKNVRNTIAKKTLKTCWDNNRDGAGILYVNQAGNLSDFKEMISFENFYKAYQYIRSITKLPVILHFRISTHGKINKDNCHPFYVNERLGFVHNGIIDIIEATPEYSDTYMFNEFLKDMPEGFQKNEAIMTLISLNIGWSKLIFMDNEGEVTIVNELDGEMHKGDWYSNGTYKDVSYYNVGGKKVLKPGKYDTEDFYEDDSDVKLMKEWEEDYTARRAFETSLEKDDYYYNYFDKKQDEKDLRLKN